jgi:DNA topoisomerase-1
LKWNTLKHNGVALPAPYDYKGFSIKIRNTTLKLNPLQEEMVYSWVKKRNTPYINDLIFASNFLQDLKKILPREFKDVKFDEIDCSEITKYQEYEGDKKNQMTKEEKKQQRESMRNIRLELKEKFGYAEVDGKRAEVLNWMVEPPGIFMGRGQHPKRGKWKPRITPKDITLNLSKNSQVLNNNWGKFIHDQNSMWLASWIDKLTGKIKYVWLHDTASIRQTRDKQKYDLAYKLEKKITRVRKYIISNMFSKKEKTRKIASVCYLIDKLSMRVGDEKDRDEADTVGASTLRVEHIRVNNPKSIFFDFLGKDSVKWEKSINIDSKASSIFLKNLLSFMRGKKVSDQIFDGVNSFRVNRFLNKTMKGLTAKVFRTHHATNVVRNYLSHLDSNREDSIHIKWYHAKKANLDAAIGCNHKRTPPKNWDQSLEKKENRRAKYLTHTPKTEKAKINLKERILKTDLEIKLSKETKEYNLNTSLRNYIDPRLYKAWSKHIDFDLNRIYPKTLQRKFMWINKAKFDWNKLTS